MPRPPVIGLTGPNASGKGVTAVHLVAAHGYAAHSLSDVVREEARARGREPVRGVLVPLGNELRRLHGPGALAAIVLPRLQPPALVDSIRNPEEVAVLRRLPGFVLVAVVAPSRVRFERSLARARPGDPETFAQFQAGDAEEDSHEATAQQLGATAGLADLVLANDATLDDLRARIDAWIAAPPGVPTPK